MEKTLEEGEEQDFKKKGEYERNRIEQMKNGITLICLGSIPGNINPLVIHL
jgi:hypothetical protein